MAISGTKGQGLRAIHTQYRKASDILTSTLAAFLFSSNRKRERDREANLNYTSADNRERQLHTTRQKSIKHKTNTHASLTKNTKNSQHK